MNKKILAIGVALMAVAMLATPVTACWLNKIPVTFDSDIIMGQFPDWWLRGNVIHGIDGTLIYENCILTGDGITLDDGAGLSTYNYHINVKGVEPTPGPPQFIFGKGVLHYKLEIAFDGGTFKGNQWVVGEFKVFDSGFVLPWNSHGFAVLRGTGAYRGWKWVFSDVTINGVPQFEAYMLIPKLP